VKPFPTIGYVGNVAMFDVGKHRVIVPLKFGSTDRALHFMPLLYRLWQEHPFSVRDGVLVQRYTKQVDGVRKEVVENAAHKLFAAHAHRDIGFEWTEVTANNGNFLFLSAENIVPERNPKAPATPAEKLHRADQEFRERIFEALEYEQQHDSYRLAKVFEIFRRYGAKFIRERIDVLSKDQLTHLQTAWVKNTLATESHLAADLTRDDVEFQNFAERKIELMIKPDLVIEPRPENHPDGVVHTPPVSPAHTSSNVPGVGDNEGDEADTAPARIPYTRFDNDYHAAEPERNVPARGYVPFTDYIVHLDVHAGLQGHWNDPSTEAVLNRHGWVTPVNGRKPTYEGKGFTRVGVLISRGEGKRS
jgi:hypothetical protein